MKYLMPSLFLLMLFMTGSCSYMPPNSRELIEADSMIMHGKYNCADSLLASYDLSSKSRHVHESMYRQLLGQARQYTTSSLSAADFSIADSLVRYFEGKSVHESSMAKLFLAEIYRYEGAYPLALNTLLQMESEVSECNNLTLSVWLNRKFGDIYFEQRMLSECTKYYRKSFFLAAKENDTLRMAHGAFSMARVCMINNDADSAIYYLNKAIEWSRYFTEGRQTEIPARSVLADIYIQIEEFEKAAAIIPHDSLNDYNWAYWHLGQHHIDSAYIYFSRLLTKSDWKSKVEYLPILSTLAEQKGNKEMALSYSKQLSAAKDSLKAHSQIEETRQAELQHHFNLVKKERDQAERHNRYMLYLLVVFVMAAIVVALVAWQVWRNYHTKFQDEASAAHRLELEASLLPVEKENIKTRQSRDKLLMNALVQSPLYERIKENAGKEGFHLTDDEWLSLAGMIDQAHEGFTSRLRMLYDGISEYELHVCYLLKIGISSTDIGNMLCKSKSAIGMTRQRLYRKLTGSKGTAKQMNDFILDF